ncbi:LOW QUALITY PROTEIN: hypothetical protein HID58_043370 [Brassica napus]|uniref:Uncharacterized protein n=1 Tax=Brassica napus TaxID=3708 RepID=A0ABQ8BGB5_BRANA|nr:LOW QUALITY PROTEIN: hypothetical protein HID58_043370 [Brassica napus]
MIRDERADRVEVGSSDVSGSGSEASSQASRSLSREIPFDQIDYRPTIYHPGGIFKELGPLPSKLLRDPRARSWGNAIAAHSHLRWPDLSREWIRRQETRIARADWESRLLVVLGPRKSRLSLFTRKQQKLLDEARKMDGVPDLSALLKGKLQLLSKKSIPADVQGSTSSDAGRASKEEAPGLVDKDVGVEPPASSPKKKKKSKKPRRKETEELPLEEIASLDETSEGLEARKGERGRKRPYEGATSSIDRGEAPAVGREGATRGSVEFDRSKAAPEDHPRKKKKKKKSVAAEPRPSDAGTGLVEVVEGGDVSLETLPEEREVSARGSDPVTGERSILDPSARKGSHSEGSTARRKKIEFPDRVEFSYNETTPLILNPLRCAELTRQIRGGTNEMPQLDDLYFRNEYIDAASWRARSDGSMNFLVEKYDSALKHTMFQLGSSEKLVQKRLKVIERVRAEHKKANEKAAEEKEILRGFPGKDGLEIGDALVREGETENVGVEDPVLVSDSSSEGREDGEEDNDGIEEASLPRPAEEETIYEAGDTDVPPRPVVDSLASIPTRAEDQTAAATKGPDDQDSVL